MAKIARGKYPKPGDTLQLLGGPQDGTLALFNGSSIVYVGVATRIDLNDGHCPQSVVPQKHIEYHLKEIIIGETTKWFFVFEQLPVSDVAL